MQILRRWRHEARETSRYIIAHSAARIPRFPSDFEATHRFIAAIAIAIVRITEAKILHVLYPYYPVTRTQGQWRKNHMAYLKSLAGLS